MPISARLKYLSVIILLSAAAVFIYSCKDDTVVTPGDDDGNNNNAEAYIEVTSPKSNDTLTVGSTFDIVWESNFESNVKIEFSGTNGSTWSTITSSTQNDGFFAWDPVPDSVSNNCYIRVSSVENSSVNDVNAGKFKILKTSKRALNLTTPNGGEFLFSGDSYRISWVSNNVSQIKLEFSSNNGSTWNFITPNYPADSGYYTWSPIPNLNSNNCLVRISDVETDTLIDRSGSAFSIGQPQVISVLSPNGGDSWPAKSSQVITWYSSQVSAVKIEYSNNNGVDWFTIIGNTESDGYYTWDPLPAIPSTNARIRISDVEDGFPSDASDSVFTVLPEEALSVIQPNGGEQWMSGSAQYIKWNGNAPGKVLPGTNNLKKSKKGFPQVPIKSPELTAQVTNVKLEYTTNSGASWNLIGTNIPNTGTYLWASVPSANSSLCKVRISDLEDGTPFDLSDSAFTIYNTIQQEISVTSPNGGEIWEAGTTQDITWSSEGVTAVKIEYTINNGLDWTTIVNSTPSDGFYTWSQVPGTSSTNCRIRISDAADNFPSDFSNSTFAIAPEPEIVVLSPNGGESLQAKSNTNIKWSSTNISNVKIEYTTNNGAQWRLIAASVPSNGLYEWKVPDSLNSALCKIRISDADDNQPYDVSNNTFSITDQVVESITLISPNGDEVWQAGTSHNITWTASGLTTVKVEFSSNNGINWTTIENNVLSSGSVEWTAININSTQCKIRVSDPADGSPADESDKSFSIQPIQTIEIIEPESGQIIIAGDPFEIKWKATGIEKVKIEYTITNSISEDGWYTLVDSIPSKGLEGSYITSFSIPSNEYRIRISDAYDNSPMVYSKGVFIVAPQPLRTITVVTPNGGENWLVSKPGGPGYSYEIRWSSTNIEKVDIDYTLNAGAVWSNIATNIPSNGLYNWVTPTTITNRSDLCQIRIKSTEDSLLYDLTNGFFSLHPESKLLRVIWPNGGENINPWDGDSDIDTVIQWTSAGINSVKLEYSIDNGNTWSTIVSSVPATGAYRWNYPKDVTSTLARIRITDASADAGSTPIEDMSDSYFFLNIRVPGLVIGNPKPFKTGSIPVINWRGSNDVKEVKIEYSVDNGKTWKIVIDRIQNLQKVNKYEWKSVPKDLNGTFTIKISDSNGKYKASNNKFKITK